jgi:hypothetical protein
MRGAFSRRAFGEAVMSIAAMGIVLLALVAIDPRVREQVSLRVSAPPSIQIAEAGREVHTLTSVVAASVRDQSIDHAPLLIFVLAAAVLFLFMLRT